MLNNRNLVLTAVFTLIIASVAIADDAKPGESVTLMGMMKPWIYPKAKFGGGEMSDAGVEGVQAIKCKSMLTTTDSVEKVVAHYCKQLKVDAETKNLDQKGFERISPSQSLMIQRLAGNPAPGLYVG